MSESEDDGEFIAQPVAEPTKLATIKEFNALGAIIVENFDRSATETLRSLLSMFGVLDIFDVITEEGATSSMAVAQYCTMNESMKALLALHKCRVRGLSLDAKLFWDALYFDLPSYAECCNRREFLETRAIYIEVNDVNTSNTMVCQKCLKYGKVEDIKFETLNEKPAAIVVYESPVSAAVAAHCMNDGHITSSGLIVGHSFQRRSFLEQPAPDTPAFCCLSARSRHLLVQYPESNRQVDAYQLPLLPFDVKCLKSQLEFYSDLSYLFEMDIPRMLPTHCFRPGPAEFCIEICTMKTRQVLMFFEVLLFDDDSFLDIQDISEAIYDKCSRAYIFGLVMNFKMYCPQYTKSANQRYYYKWISLLILDILITKSCFQPEPVKMDLRIQAANHFYSQEDPFFREDSDLPLAFGSLFQHRLTTFTAASKSTDIEWHKRHMATIVERDMTRVRLVGSVDDMNDYQLGVRITSNSVL